MIEAIKQTCCNLLFTPGVKDGCRMRLEYEDEELRCLAYDPHHRTSRWAPSVTTAYRRRIQQLQAAPTDQVLRSLKSLHLEKMKGDRAGTWSIRIDMKYRLILRFQTAEDGRIAIVIEAVTYH